MVILVYDCDGVILTHIVPRRQTVNAQERDGHCETVPLFYCDRTTVLTEGQCDSPRQTGHHHSARHLCTAANTNHYYYFCY
jgi:hypothetical protein